MCGIEYTYPMPSKEKLRKFYSAYFDLRATDEVATRNATRNLNFIKSNIVGLHKHTSILDYGCGKNAFINVCRQENEGGILNSYGYDMTNMSIVMTAILELVMNTRIKNEILLPCGAF